jgi:two-component system chemotaxis sensor kinase CheA
MSAEETPIGFVIEDEEIIVDFITEASEFLLQLDQDLIQLEQTPQDLELLNAIFRAVHTIKGNAGFLGFEKLTRFTHQFENLLDQLRSGQTQVSATIMDLILASVDTLKALIQHLRQPEQVDINAIQNRLQQCLNTESDLRAGPGIDPEMQEIIEDFKVEARELIEGLDQDLVRLEQQPGDLELLNQIFRAVHTIKGNAGFLGFDSLSDFTHQLENLLDRLRSGQMDVTPTMMDVILASADMLKRLLQGLGQEAPVNPDSVRQRITACLEGGQTAAPPAATVVPESPPRVEVTRQLEDATIRVDVQRLDALMNLAGELVIAKNRLSQFTSQFEAQFDAHELSESLLMTTHMLNLITAQIQEAVMKTRMLPIRKVFSRVPRMIRDLARDTRKQVRLVMTGEETELDKSIIEYIGDPLVHIIRNAVDHGLESPEARIKAGKNPEGTVFLSAASEGNYIVIEIRDDGRGMDPHKIFAKAVEKGLAQPEDSLHLSETDMLNFIFAPGFSTAETISNISGRGVGMNVVKENIIKLDGLIEIDSTPGHGSRFRIQLPLTMAIVPALLVQVQHFTYAIPLNHVVETLAIQPAEIFQIGEKTVIHLRDRFISLVPLAEILEHPAPPPQQKCYVIIVGVGEQRMGLLVDQLLRQEEVVIKPLGDFFAGLELIAGVTIMGDGRVMLILDIAQILQHLSRKPIYLNQGGF